MTGKDGKRKLGNKHASNTTVVRNRAGPHYVINPQAGDNMVRAKVIENGVVIEEIKLPSMASILEYIEGKYSLASI